MALARELRAALAGFIDSPTAMAAVLPDTRMILVNRALEILIGRTGEELIGRSALSFLPPEEQGPAAEDLARRSVEATDPFTTRWHALRPDGERVPVYLTNLIVRDASGAVWYIVSRILRASETTEGSKGSSPHAESQLIAEIRAAIPDFATTPTGVAATTVDGRILAANQAFAEPLGYTSDELAGVLTRDLGAAGETGDEAIRRATLEATGIVPAAVVAMVHKTGDVVRLRTASILVRDGRGRPRFILVTGGLA